MAKRSILVSDFSGDEVFEEDGANIRVTFGDSEEAWVFDATKEEAKQMFTDKKTGEVLGRVQGKRGRKAGSTNGKPAEAAA